MNILEIDEHAIRSILLHLGTIRLTYLLIHYLLTLYGVINNMERGESVFNMKDIAQSASRRLEPG